MIVVYFMFYLLVFSFLLELKSKNNAKLQAYLDDKIYMYNMIEKPESKYISFGIRIVFYAWLYLFMVFIGLNIIGYILLSLITIRFVYSILYLVNFYHYN